MEPMTAMTIRMSVRVYAVSSTKRFFRTVFIQVEHTEDHVDIVIKSFARTGRSTLRLIRDRWRGLGKAFVLQ